MTVTAAPSSQSKPYDQLRSSSANDQPNPERPGHDLSSLTDESKKLDQLKSALWEAFVSAPSDGLPTPLIDLVSTYVSALRMKLSLASYARAGSRAAKAVSIPRKTL